MNRRHIKGTSISNASRMETLENRQLFSNVIDIFTPPAGGNFPTVLTAGPDGNVWYTNGLASKLGRVSPNGDITLFTTPHTANGLTKGPDGNLWMTTDGFIDKVTPSGTTTSFAIKASFVDPRGITAGPDGALWFACGLFGKIGRITTSGSFTIFPDPKGIVENGGITAGPDGALWFSANNAIGRISTGGTFKQFHLKDPNSDPRAITKGHDGNLWFIETNNNKVGRITPQGVITEFTLPIDASKPKGIAAGADGNIWVTQGIGTNSIGHIARVTPSGSITEFAMPVPLAGPDLQGITSGPDGNIWFGAGLPNRIGRISIAAADPDPNPDPNPNPNPGPGTGTGSVTGTIFNDKNGNGKREKTEKGIKKVTVFLDANKNGLLDEGELSTVTNTSGVYHFKNVPLKLFRVRQILPAKFKRTSKKVFFTIDLSLGKTVLGELFGDKKIG